MTSNTIKLFPTSLNGNLNTVSSKSISHRAIIAASLSDKKTIIRNISLSKDIKATLNAVEAMGVKIAYENKTIHIIPPKKRQLHNRVIDCNESGSTLRFMIPVLSIFSKKISFTGKSSLLKRPMDLYKDVFKKSDASFIQKANNILIEGSIKPNIYELDGSISSQFITGLLFSLPLLETDSKLIIKGKFESKSYVDLTLSVLSHFGVSIVERDNIYLIKGNQSYISKNFNVEGDYSQAAFFLTAGILNGNIKLFNLPHNSQQGDRAIIDIIERFKGKVIRLENGYQTLKSKTVGSTVDLSDCPDLGPIIALMGCLSAGNTRLINAGRLRIKESDRIHSTVTTLSKLGANIVSQKDEIIITGVASFEGGISLDSFNDHRIAMMISVAALKCNNPITLTNALAINKSYPSFFDDYKFLGGIIEEME